VKQANLIRQLFVIVDSQEWDRLDEVFKQDVEYHRPGYDCIKGIDDLRLFYEKTRMISTGQHEICYILADTMRGSCWGHFRGKRKSGESIAEEFAEWYEFSGVSISSRRTFFYRPAV
jgi:ketosteroid isomerase-like protein